MAGIEVKAYDWVKLEWDNFFLINPSPKTVVIKNVRDFLELKYNSLARDLSIPESELKELIESQNKEFFALIPKERFTLPVDGPVFQAMMETFKVPRIPASTKSVQELLEGYKTLTPFERVEFGYGVDDFEMRLMAEAE